MGSPSLIILLIIVVWVIVLAPMMIGKNKPILRAGEGYEETRVLHEGGTPTVATRRRPKLTAADVHRHDDEDDEYEVVEAVADEEQVLIDDTSRGLKPLFPKRVDAAEATEAESPAVIEVIDADEDEAEVEVEPGEEAPATGGSTAYSVLLAQQEAAEAEVQAEVEDKAEDELEEQDNYQIRESYLAPEDFAVIDHEDDEVDEVDEVEAIDEPGDAADEAVEATEDAADVEAPAELDEADIAFAESRRGRGGWDPQRDAARRADRQQRRQRTLLALLASCVITFVAAVVAGGWVWALPAIAVALTAWFMVVLRRTVKQERALRARRMQQLRRARLGVDTAERPAPAARERRRAGSIILDLDDTSPDFDHLPRYRQPEPDHASHRDERRTGNPGDDDNAAA